jgi:hypothetical protein
MFLKTKIDRKSVVNKRSAFLIKEVSNPTLTQPILYHLSIFALHGGVYPMKLT